MIRAAAAGLVVAGLCGAAPVAAQEVWAGISAHAVDTPLTKDIAEDGADIQAGYRFAPVRALSAIGAPAPYVVAVVNSDGGTSLLAAGLGWKLGGRLFARPAIGLAVHDGPRRRIDRDGTRLDLGSRVLFAPELAIGWQVTPRIAVEASWIHVSHAQLFSRQNPGLDIIGARLVVALR